MNIRLIIACHKPCEVPADPMYLPVHVGSAGKETMPGFTRDDEGDSISEKNPVFCELTGLYWAWKNLDCDALGLVHYRRYFTMKRRLPGKEAALSDVLSGQEAEQLLEKYQVIVPKKRHYYIETVWSHYCHTFDGSQFETARQIIAERTPEYLPDFDRLMAGTTAWLFNMYIMRKELSDEYCEWMFSIVFELERRTDTTGMNDFDLRFGGRVSERLFDTWLMHQMRTGRIPKQDVREIPYLYLGHVDWNRKITGFLKAKFLHKKYDRSF